MIIYVLLIILIVFLVCNKRTEGAGNVISEKCNTLTSMTTDGKLTTPSLNVNGHIMMNKPNKDDENLLETNNNLVIGGKRVILKSLGNGTLIEKGSTPSEGDGNLTVDGNLIVNGTAKLNIKRYNVRREYGDMCEHGYYVCGVRKEGMGMGMGGNLIMECCSFKP
jgi:hypothetical protein